MGWIYRDRWEIELFFKMLKQHLKIKTFVGTSPNALKTQIWTALIAVLLLKYLQFRSKCNLPLCRLIALLRLNLFSYRNLFEDGGGRKQKTLPESSRTYEKLVQNHEF